MKTYSFLERSLSAKQRQSMELRKRVQDQELQTKQAFNASINQAITQSQELQEIDWQDFYKYRLSKTEGFHSTPSLCQVFFGGDELDNFKDYTRI